MARKTSTDYEATKQALLQVGLALFEEKGYNATGLQEIASGAAISKGSFYSYFSSKEDFGVGVIRYYTETGLRHWKSMFDEAAVNGDVYAALQTTFTRMTEKYKAADIKKGCLLGNLSAEISEASDLCRIELQASVNQYKALLTKNLTKAQAKGQVRLDLPAEGLAALVWDTWQGSLLRMQIETSVEPVTDNLALLFEHLLLP